MFESMAVAAGGPGAGSRATASELDAPALVEVVSAHAVTLGAAALAHRLGSGGGCEGEPGAGDDGAALVDLISALEDLTAATAALQARAAVELDRVRRAEEAERGVAADKRGRGVAAEVGLAARMSVSRAGTLLGFGKALCTEMPYTMAALAAGRLSPWRAMLLVKESACLELEDRARLDEDLCADPAVLAGLGDRRVGDAARAWCCREDAAAVVRRRSRAEADRRVSLRPAPDTMAYLTALLPVAEGVAAYAALLERADSARANGDERSRGQVMADALVARVTGQQEGAAPGVLVNLVMTDRALFSGDGEPALVPGYGPVPAATARDLVAKALSGAGGIGGTDTGTADGSGATTGGTGEVGRAKAWVRRLYTAPGSGALVAMDARTRRVPTGLAELIALRDGGVCRVPWCDAPVRHIDHVVGVAEGGATQEQNLQGGCEAHNYAKQAPGWSAVPHTAVEGAEHTSHRAGGVAGTGGVAGGNTPAQRHRVRTRTPSGHVYDSTAPPLPGHRRSRTRARPERADERSPGERLLAEALARVA